MKEITVEKKFSDWSNFLKMRIISSTWEHYKEKNVDRIGDESPAIRFLVERRGKILMPSGVNFPALHWWWRWHRTTLVIAPTFPAIFNSHYAIPTIFTSHFSLFPKFPQLPLHNSRNSRYATPTTPTFLKIPTVPHHFLQFSRFPAHNSHHPHISHVTIPTIVTIPTMIKTPTIITVFTIFTPHLSE